MSRIEFKDDEALAGTLDQGGVEHPPYFILHAQKFGQARGPASSEPKEITPLPVTAAKAIFEKSLCIGDHSLFWEIWNNALRVVNK